MDQGARVIFAIALFDDTGAYRGVVTSTSPDPDVPVLNGKRLHAVDLGSFDYAGAVPAQAKLLHESFEPHPASTVDAPRVAIKPDAVDVARRDLNVPATTEGLKALMRTRGPAAIPRHIGEAIALRMGEAARTLGLPRPHPADREHIRALFQPVAEGGKLKSIKHLPAVRAEREALKQRDRALRERAIGNAAWQDMLDAINATPPPEETLPEPTP